MKEHQNQQHDKKRRRQKIMTITRVVGVIVIGGAFMAVAASAQQFDTSSLELVSRDQVPDFCTVWALRADGSAVPLPCLPFNYLDAPVYALPNGSFLLDETSVETSAMGGSARSMALEDDSEEGGGDDSMGPPADIANYQKFMGQAFSVIDTNDAALNNIQLYNACVSFPNDTNTVGTLQIALYGTGAVIVKASHFDYSAETARDFALLVCDNVARPTWKTIDLSGASDSQDGWLIQGLVSRYDVTDPMYFMITNMSQAYRCFFQAIPYGGPQIQLSGAQPNDTVAGLLTLYASIADLSGAKGQQLAVSVNGLTPRYSLGPSNSIVIDTEYTPNGVVDVTATAQNFNATLLNLTNAPADAKLDFDTRATLSLDFENQTYVYFPGDMSETNIGVNPIVFGVTPPRYITAALTEPSSGRTLASFSGYDPNYSYVELDWNFTEADGATPYTNDQYVVTFTASTGQSLGATTLTMTNKIERNHVRTARWVISTYEEIKPSSEHGNGGWVNSEMAKWGAATEAMYESLYSYDFFSQTLYYTWQIGAGRDNPTSPAMPLILNPTTQAGWPGLVYSVVTNRSYSDFNYGPGHGRAYLIGGGEYSISWMNYVNTSISANDMQTWVQTGATGPNANTKYKMRKVTVWSCYSGRKGVYSSWYNTFGINPSQMNTLSGKNAGLFFNDELKFLPYGTPATDVAEVAAEFDQIWVMGANPYPGGCDPNYAFQFAYNVTLMMFPELAKAQPMIIGCPYLPYAGVYDDQLMNNNFSQVRMY